jgi:SH2 domain.
MPVYDDISLIIHSWFFKNVSRKEAEKLLLSEENARGTYLVRHSEHNPEGYSLSVKDWEETRGYHVKHYKIKPLDNGGYYIATNQVFSTLQALVQAYSSECLKQIIFLFIILFNSLSVSSEPCFCASCCGVCLMLLYNLMLVVLKNLISPAHIRNKYNSMIQHLASLFQAVYSFEEC